MTHDYKRHGTTDLFAALNIVATGEVLYDTRKRHTARDVLAFFKLIDLHVPKDLHIHVVLDNLSAHKAPDVSAQWLAPSPPGSLASALCSYPARSSWLNLVERLVQGAHRPDVCAGECSCSVPALIDAIEVWVERRNDDPKPLMWTGHGRS